MSSFVTGIFDTNSGVFDKFSDVFNYKVFNDHKQVAIIIDDFDEYYHRDPDVAKKVAVNLAHSSFSNSSKFHCVISVSDVSIANRILRWNGGHKFLPLLNKELIWNEEVLLQLLDLHSRNTPTNRQLIHKSIGNPSKLLSLLKSS